MVFGVTSRYYFGPLGNEPQVADAAQVPGRGQTL